MRQKSNVRILLALLLCSQLQNGCKVGPNYAKPATPYLDQNWTDAAHPRLNGEPIDLCNWWESFGDPTLVALIHDATCENLQIKEAGKRILEARALRNVAAGNLYPQQQSLDTSFTDNRISGNVANFVVVPGFFETDRTFNNWQTGFGIAWELDFWGRFRRTVEAADAQVDQSIAGLNAVRVLVLSEVAKNYIELRSLEARIAIANKHVAIQKRLYDLSQARLEEGAGNKLDVHQSASRLANVEAVLPGLEILRRQASHRLCVLLGRTPADLESVLGSTGQIPNPPQNVAAGIPSDLLRRRPDVHVAERELATQSAKIGISEAEFYPHISLVGQIGLQSEDLSRLFQTDSLIGAVGPGVRWNLLNYGRIKNKWIADKEAFQRLAYTYHGSVLNAYREVEDSQVAYLRGFDRVEAIERTVHESSEAARIGYDTFVEGGVDFGRVLILQTDLVRAEDELLAARSDVALSLVKLFLSLGGGWTPSGCHNVQMASHPMVRH